MKKLYTMIRHRAILRYLIVTVISVLLVLLLAMSGPSRNRTVILIKRGTSIDAMAHQLKYEGVIRSVQLFKVLAKLLRVRPISGEYEFVARVNLLKVINKLKHGNVLYTNISVPPGSHGWAIQQRFSDFIPKEKFWALWKNPRFMRIAGFPNAENMEGLVAPLVYQVNHTQDPEEIFLHFAESFRRTVMPTLNGGVISAYDTLILASLIEKETSVPNEMALIAGVYIRRLKQKMKLQCDPTSLYARWYHGDLQFTGPTSKDINRLSRFNTYAVFGLPPTPIASPSPKAIAAAKLPNIGNNIYFSATGDGGHVFASRLSDHNHNVSIYRRKIALRRRALKYV